MEYSLDSKSGGRESKPTALFISSLYFLTGSGGLTTVTNSMCSRETVRAFDAINTFAGLCTRKVAPSAEMCALVARSSEYDGSMTGTRDSSPFFGKVSELSHSEHLSNAG